MVNVIGGERVPGCMSHVDPGRADPRHAHTGRVGQKLTAGNGSVEAFESAISRSRMGVPRLPRLAPGSGLSPGPWLRRLKTDLLDAV